MIKKTMLMCIICLIGYFSVFADGFTPQDIEELETAGQEEVFGGGINAGLIGTMYYNAYSLGIGTGFQAGLGGKGGMEFFVNHLTASFIEFGGIEPLYSSNPSKKMQSFFFCGGFRLFL